MKHRQPRTLSDSLRAALRASGFETQLSAAASGQLQKIVAEKTKAQPASDATDMRDLLWSSIDNKQSRDLDQIEIAERISNDEILIRVGIADVDAYVPKSSPIDASAQTNTTSVYAGGAVVPMLPRELSEGITSLNEGADRLAIVIETKVCTDGSCKEGRIYRALVRNHAKLDYDSIGGWLEGGKAPPRMVKSKDLAGQVKLQDEAAQRLRTQRERNGALELDTIEANPVVRDGKVIDIELQKKTRARDLIEDFMIASNVTIATFLENNDVAWIRRIVRVPERWPRIVDLARKLGETLPAQPDRMALAQFLRKRRAADPVRFADLSLSIVKLLGSGEYVVEHKGEELEGHFGLAVQDYTHSTAPNRRYADLITQRLVKAVLAKQPQPYTDEELDAIAKRCTDMEDESHRLERRIRKLSATALLADKIGESFDAIVTGRTDHGVFVRLLVPPVEGRVTEGEQGLDVGDEVRVKLLFVDPEKGYIDFGVDRP
jgi:VacB/RNase II family 3'-5' exoribonuclease